MLIHVVKKGEMLWQIANYYNSSISEIIKVNGLFNPNQLLVGQSLIIPSEGVLYTVKIGDTLWKIAEKYGVSMQAIIEENKIININNIYPGVVLIIPEKQKPSIEVNSYTYVLGEAAVPLVEEVGDLLTYLSPFAYVIEDDGGLRPLNDLLAIETANSKNVTPMMSIVNFTMTTKGENLAHVVLNSPQLIETLLNNMINVMREKGYEGVNIDFENVLPEDREPYNEFLLDTVDRMHREGYFVSTALAPKTSKEQRGLLYEAHDYEAHGRIADFVVLMTYEWGWSGGPPQAVSPINEMKKVLEYAVSVIPRNKIIMGFQIYARDWLLPHVKGQIAETFSMQEAIARAVKYGVAIQYDEIAQSPHFNYTDEQVRAHEVWFEDARSAQAKFDLAKQYNLRGISYWTLGYPFPQNWVLLEDNFITIKR